jgi:hypothetical protein
VTQLLQKMQQLLATEKHIKSSTLTWMELFPSAIELIRKPNGSGSRKEGDVDIDMIRRVLRQERGAGKITCVGRGPQAKWRKSGQYTY